MYEQRTAWYVDSRTSPLSRPLLALLAKHRAALGTCVAELRPEVAKLAGSEDHELIALKKLWCVQGDLAVIEMVQVILPLMTADNH